MRLFFALWPPPETARALGEWARKVQQASSGRVTRDETIHLTLAFLGEAQSEKAVAAARQVTAKAFDFPLEMARYWPHNRIVWVGPRDMPGSLSELVRQLDASLMVEGLLLEKRPFAAHVTLLRKASKLEILPDLPSVAWPVSEFVLVRSSLSPQGSRYEVVERFPLRG